MNLYIFQNHQFVGTIEKNQGQWSFEYSPDWLADPNAFAVSSRLPLQKTKFKHFPTQSFFANLLPEDIIKTQMAKMIGVAEKNDFEILSKIGGDCAGALSFYPDKESAQDKGTYEPLTDDQLHKGIAQSANKPLMAVTPQLRLALAGVQQKLPVYKENGKYHLPLGNAASTHILKPQSGPFKGLVENEYFCMQLAKSIGLPVAETELQYIKGIPVLEVKRYDREREGEKVKKIHQEDFCQALGLSPEQKYEAEEGGANLQQCFSVLEKQSANPQKDKQSLLRWVFFNYLIGNADAHAKNISILHQNQQASFAPAYDLIATIVYDGLINTLSMKIGKEKKIGRLQEKHLETLAEMIPLARDIIFQEFEDMKARLPEASCKLAKKLNKKVQDGMVMETICKYIEKQQIKRKFKI